MKRKEDKLKMKFGTAQSRLKKAIMFYLAQQAGLDTCFRCFEKIENLEDFSIDHKIDWQNSQSPVDLFFDINNIAFSHFDCNVNSRNKRFTVTSNSKARYKGVHFSPKNKRSGIDNKPWRAVLEKSKDNKRRKYFGYFETPEEAAIAYDKEVLKIYEKSAVTNKKLGLL